MGILHNFSLAFVEDTMMRFYTVQFFKFCLRSSQIENFCFYLCAKRDFFNANITILSWSNISIMKLIRTRHIIKSLLVLNNHMFTCEFQETQINTHELVYMISFDWLKTCSDYVAIRRIVLNFCRVRLIKRLFFVMKCRVMRGNGKAVNGYKGFNHVQKELPLKAQPGEDVIQSVEKQQKP